jgi:hypothetical protein
MAFPLDTNASRTGQVNKAGNSRELFYKLFSGEVLTTFHAENIAMNLTRSRTIKSGKSKAFPLIGQNKAAYHKVGQLINGNKIGHAERIINIDDIAVAPVFIADIDEAMESFEVRSQYSKENGESLAGLLDRNIFRMIAKAAAITSAAEANTAGLKVLPEETYTANITLASAGDEDDGAKIVNALFKARTQLKNAKVREQAVVVIPPEQYEALVNVQDVSKVTWINKDVGGVGSMSEGVIPRIAGMSIYETLNLPQEDESASLSDDPEPISDTAEGSGNAAKYRGDYSALVALVFTESAVGTLKLMDLTTVVVPEPLRLGTTMLSKLAVGHDILRPCCAVAIYKAA